MDYKLFAVILFLTLISLNVTTHTYSKDTDTKHTEYVLKNLEWYFSKEPYRYVFIGERYTPNILYDAHPPLFYLLYGMAAHIHVSPLMLNTLFYMVSLYFFYVIIRMYTETKTAYLALALFAFNPVILNTLIQTRMYSLLLCLSLASWVSLLREQRDTFALYTLLGLATHYYYVLVLVLQAWQFKRWRWLLDSVPLATPVLVLFFVQAYHTYGYVVSQSTTRALYFPLLSDLFFGVRSYTWWGAVLWACMAGLLVWSYVNVHSRYVFFLGFGLPLFSVVTYYTVGLWVSARYFIFCIPALYVCFVLFARQVSEQLTLKKAFKEGGG